MSKNSQEDTKGSDPFSSPNRLPPALLRIFIYTFNMMLLFALPCEPRRLSVELRGLEPRTPCLQSRCSSQLSYSPGQWAWQELNLRPHAYQACALTT